MLPSTHRSILDTASAIETSMAQICELMAMLDASLFAFGRSWALPVANVTDRASAAMPDAQNVEDDDVANARVAARVMEALSAAGMTCELRHLGLSLH